jgi:tetratricopeptide (TPR) repeat protein
MSTDVKHFSELELPVNPDHPEWPRWSTVRLHFDIQSFGINAWTAAEVGSTIISEHDELGDRAGNHEELYFVAKGRARFTVAGDEIDAPAGTFVFVRDLAAKRAAVAEEPETTVLVAGGKPGEAFEPSAWERSAPAFAYWGTREWDKAIEILEQTLEEYGEDPAVLFNLACAESLAGRRDDALNHLRRSVELDETFAELAEKDTDFDPIRDDPEFASAISGKSHARSSSS